MSRSALLATLAIACGSRAPATGPALGTSHGTPAVADASIDGAVALDDDLPRLAARSIAMYDEWLRAMTEAGDDCAAAIAKVNAVADRNADVIAANARVLHAGRDKVRQMRAALEPHAAELEANGQALAHSPAMLKCHDDPAFAKAVERIGGES